MATMSKRTLQIGCNYWSPAVIHKRTTRRRRDNREPDMTDRLFENCQNRLELTQHHGQQTRRMEQVLKP